MKKTVLALALALTTAVTASAKDVIFLKDGSKVKGDIARISEGQVTILTNKSSRVLTSDQVSYIKADANTEALVNAVLASDPSAYEQGRLDASKYHRRGVGNAALGFLFGPFGVLGVAIGGAKAPDIMDVKDESLMKNEDYREGYKRKAKGKNLANAALGWGVWIGVVILAASAA